MGFLTINGMLMTYDEYKTKTTCYKALGMMQFVNLHNIYKDRHIKEEDLHWGEEIEYHLFHLDDITKTVKLSCDAPELLSKYKNFSEEDQK